MAYIPITDTQIDPDAPLTSQLMYQNRDNPIEMAGGATGAPKVQGIALDNLWLGRRNTYGGSGATSVVAERVKVLRLDYCGQLFDAIAFSTDGGSSYGVNQIFSTQVSAAGEYAIVDTDAGNVTLHDGTVDSITVPSGFNAFQIRLNGGGSRNAAVWIMGGLA
jgi:hypothetical protein